MYNFRSSSNDLISRRGVFSRRHYGSVELVSKFTLLLLKKNKAGEKCNENKSGYENEKLLTFNSSSRKFNIAVNKYYVYIEYALEFW